MKHSELKKLVFEKFGTIKKFSDLAALNYEATKEFLNRNYESITEAEFGRIEMMRKLAGGLVVKPTSSELTEMDCEMIKQGIRIVHGSITSLSKSHPKWSLSSLNDLTNRRRKRRSKRVNDLVGELVKSMDEMVLSDWEFQVSVQLKKIIENEKDKDKN